MIDFAEHEQHLRGQPGIDFIELCAMGRIQSASALALAQSVEIWGLSVSAFFSPSLQAELHEQFGAKSLFQGALAGERPRHEIQVDHPLIYCGVWGPGK